MSAYRAEQQAPVCEEAVHEEEIISPHLSRRTTSHCLTVNHDRKLEWPLSANSGHSIGYDY